MKYFDKKTLVIANEIAKKRGYNRQLTDNICSLNENLRFPIVFSMIHEHAAGIRVDPHVRCVISICGTTAQIDCDSDLYNLLNDA